MACFITKLAMMGVITLFVSSCGNDTSSRSSSSTTSSSSSSSSASSSSTSSNSGGISSGSISSGSISSIYPNYNTTAQAANATGMSSTALQLSNKMTLGWNLGNTLEAIGGETAWGNPTPTRALMQAVKQNGFDAIRLPISWDQYAQQGTAEIDPNWLEHIKNVVQYAVDANLYVLVNIHWDNGWLENNITPSVQKTVNEKQHAYWTQIATQLRDFDEHVMFASANEPHVEDAEEMSILMSYHQTFVDAVRATGGRNAYRVLVIQGPSTSMEKTDQLMHSLPTDLPPNRLMVEVHSYTPYQFTLMVEPQDWGFTAFPFFYWGDGNHSSGDTDHNPTWGEESQVDQEFALMKRKYADKGIPVILGEYAAMRRNDQVPDSERDKHYTSRSYWHRYVTQKAIQNGMIPFYWDAGGLEKYGSGIFNRHDYSIFDQETLNALKQGAGK